MSTITVLRHVFTIKPRNRAKDGPDAPNEGYINAFPEKVPEPETQEDWAYLDEWLIREKEEAEAALATWLKRSKV